MPYVIWHIAYYIWHIALTHRVVIHRFPRAHGYTNCTAQEKPEDEYDWRSIKQANQTGSLNYQPISAGRFRSCELRACIRMRTEQYGCRTDAQTLNLSEVTDVRISQKPPAGGAA
jgi:hypothetical protein